MTVNSGVVEALPATVRPVIYTRVWQVLSGRDANQRSRRLSPADRQATIEILRATKADWPDYFRGCPVLLNQSWRGRIPGSPASPGSPI